MRIPHVINIGKNSVFYPAENEADGVIVFVHGLLGSSEAAWSRFNHLLTEDTSADRYDLIFYGYPTRYRQLGSLAAGFRLDLEALISKISAVVSESTASRCNLDSRQRYKRIVIVGHSMGAVMARKALMDLRSLEKWADLTNAIESIKLVFYAPAHGGANPQGVVSLFAAIGDYSRIVKFGLDHLLPSVRDLTANSDFIKALRSQANALSVKDSQTVAEQVSTVIHGELDNVVMVLDFPHDPPIETIKGVGHRRVCKPTDEGDERYILLKVSL